MQSSTNWFGAYIEDKKNKKIKIYINAYRFNRSFNMEISSIRGVG